MVSGRLQNRNIMCRCHVENQFFFLLLVFILNRVVLLLCWSFIVMNWFYELQRCSFKTCYLFPIPPMVCHIDSSEHRMYFFIMSKFSADNDKFSLEVYRYSNIGLTQCLGNIFIHSVSIEWTDWYIVSSC